MLKAAIISGIMSGVAYLLAGLVATTVGVQWAAPSLLQK